MPNTSIDPSRLLAAWLRRLVELCRAQGGETWRALTRAASGREAVIELDHCRLRLRAQGGSRLRLSVRRAGTAGPVNFRARGDTLRDLISGRQTLDAALCREALYVRGTLRELLDVHGLVMRLLGDAALNAGLRQLWSEFDTQWPIGPMPTCESLEAQSPAHGAFVRQIPESVLRVELGETRRRR